MKPLYHAMSSVKRFGGVLEDYLPIHDLMDSSKGVLPDNRHRALTHTSWFLSTILERVFGDYLTNHDGKLVAVRDVGEQHIAEDFHGFIPTAQDFLVELDYLPWMAGTVPPPSFQKVQASRTSTRRQQRWDQTQIRSDHD